MPAVAGPDNTYRREPDLLTHRDDDYLMDGQDADADQRGEPMLSEEELRRRKRKKVWKWIRRTLYVLIFFLITGPIVAFYFIYQNVSVPDPHSVAVGQAQPVTIYYADNSVMDRLTIGARTFIQPNQIPINVRHAVEAAEDETFETNAGFDIRAILRTGWNQLTGGVGGGSTITQEYIKVATGNDQASLSRKITEAVEAYKMTKTYPDKNTILAAYLNIVYFGRGAYGIESAAQAYFGVSAAKLTPEQAALLAGLIQLPGRANNPAYQHRRFTYVWGRLLANHWITQTQHDAAQFPTPLDPTTTGHQALQWSRQLIENQVLDELESTDGWSEQALKTNGAQIYTTIQPPAQQAAEAAVQTTLAKDAPYMGGGPLVVPHRGTITASGKPGGPPVMATEAGALVSINPTNGEIIAYYGGNDKAATQLDMASTPHQPGSSFKPYVFAGALERDPKHIGLNSIFDDSEGIIAGTQVHNSDGEKCQQPCTVKQAMTQSINTVFYRMGQQISTDNVRKAALQAGIAPTMYDPLRRHNVPSLASLYPDSDKIKQVEGGISIGQYPVRVLDQAQGYATFANNGMYIPAHFVKRVTDITGQKTLFEFNTPAKPAFDPDPTKSAQIARTVSDSMTDVAGESKFGLAKNRPADAKTGTQGFNFGDGATGHNSDAWTVGFTPGVVTATWFGHTDKPGPIFGNVHNGSGATETGYDVFGREEPGYMWKAFMDAYLSNVKPEQFPTSPADIGGSWDFVTNSDASQQTYTPRPSSPPTLNQPTQTPNQPTSTPDQPPPTTDPTFFPTTDSKHRPPTTTLTPTCPVPGGCGGGPGGGGGPPPP